MSENTFTDSTTFDKTVSISNSSDEPYALNVFGNVNISDNVKVSTINGYHIQPVSNTEIGTTPTIPILKTDGVIELGRYIDMRQNISINKDYDIRLSLPNTTTLAVTAPSGIMPKLMVGPVDIVQEINNLKALL